MSAMRRDPGGSLGTPPDTTEEVGRARHRAGGRHVQQDRRRRHRSSRRGGAGIARLVTVVLAVGVVLATGPITAAISGSTSGNADDPELVIDADSTWSFWREREAPAPDWTAVGFDDSRWSEGAAPFGYGTRLPEGAVETRLPDFRRQVLTTYFRQTFDVDLAQRPTLRFDTWADDGIVVYVNGTEVGRSRVSEARTDIPHDAIWATGAPRTRAAQGEQLAFEIDPRLLQDGDNVIAVIVIANWRKSFDVTFGGELSVVRTDPPSSGPGEPPTSDPVEPPSTDPTEPPTSDPVEPPSTDPTEPPTSDPVEPPTSDPGEPPTSEPGQPGDPAGPLPDGDVIPFGATWEYYRDAAGPRPTWKFQTDPIGWRSAVAPFGYGPVTKIVTALTGSGTPLSTYFRNVFTVEADSRGLLTEGAQLTTWADDGIIVFVNGHEVGRHRVPDSVAGEHDATWAAAAPSSSAARGELLTFAVPGAYLVEGENVVAVQVVSNHHGTRDLSFDGRLTPGGGGSVPAPVRPQQDWDLVWSDEFGGSQLDGASWNAHHLSTYGDGNLETACLMNRPENLSVHDGHLHLTALREPTPIGCGSGDARFPHGREFSSAHITTQGKVTLAYGRVEIRAQVPVSQGDSQGLWPAFWLRTNNGAGEIDILEALGSGASSDWQAGVAYHSLHESTNGGAGSARTAYELPMGADMADSFHTYAVEWEENEIRFFIDDVMTARYTASEVPWLAKTFNEKEFFIRLNLAVGGRWPGDVDGSTALPASFVIDYVRVYEPR